MSKRYGTVEDRFWRYVHPEPNSGCWLWDGPADDFGYARFRVGERKKRGHVWAYERFVGAVPAGLIVRHRCDVPCCVNPDHLKPGTHQDNVDDRTARGRGVVGERSPFARLTREQVRDIRASTLSKRKLAAIYGVSDTTVYRARTAQTWRCVHA